MVAMPAMTRVAATTMLLRRGLRLGAGGLRPCLHLGARGLGLRAGRARRLAPRLLLGLGASGLRLRTRLLLGLGASGLRLCACLLLSPSASGLGLGTGLRLGLPASETLCLHARCAGGLGSDALLIARRGLRLGPGGIDLRAGSLPRLHLRALGVSRLCQRLMPLSVELRGHRRALLRRRR